MLVSPLLSHNLVEQIHMLLKKGRSEKEILSSLEKLSPEEKIHILRWIYNRCELSQSEIEHVLTIWRSLVPGTHPFHSADHKKALYHVGQWWDAFGEKEGMTIKQYDELERLLDGLGYKEQGKEYFKWVALYPVINIDENDIWDEDRRGAIVCLGKYGCGKNIELFLARHLDDWSTIQIEVVQILAAMKSRLLAKLAPWYIENDTLLKPILEEFF